MIRFPDKANAGLPCHRGPVMFASPGSATYWTPALLFSLGQAGFFAGGHKPDAFNPALLFGSATDGFYGGGHEPDPFTPALMFGPNTAGFYGGEIEVS